MLAPARLSGRAREVLEDKTHELVWSCVGTWEVAIKVQIGKLRLPAPLPRFIASACEDLGLARLDVTQAHALEVATLPLHHRDPFDRILVAQAIVEKLSLLTSEARLRAYPLDVVW